MNLFYISKGLLTSRLIESINSLAWKLLPLISDSPSIIAAGHCFRAKMSNGISSSREIPAQLTTWMCRKSDTMLLVGFSEKFSLT